MVKYNDHLKKSNIFMFYFSMIAASSHTGMLSMFKGLSGMPHAERCPFSRAPHTSP